MSLAATSRVALVARLVVLTMVPAFALSAQNAPSEPSPPSVAAVVRLELPGRVTIRTLPIDSVGVTARASVRGRTPIGVSNARTREPYRVTHVRRADTIVVRPADRPPLRTVGLTWVREDFDHQVDVPDGATVLIVGAKQLVIDGEKAGRCASRAWRRASDGAAACIGGAAW
jgi:hypothetical protein